ncbi:MAG: endonuclease [Actinomycetota bacterium]|nr:endonuclease [Actinomycetota bacterium]
MPEGDTVFLAATRLDGALRGKALTRSDFRVPRYATVDLAGQVVENVVPRGKHLLFRIDDGHTLHTHYKMEGAWHLYRPGETWRGPDHQVRAVLTTDEWVAVGFRLAVVELIPTSEETEAVGHLGPDPLQPDWDLNEAVRRFEKHGDEQVGTVVLDQSVMAGPGNVYKSEICFLRGVHPNTLVRDVPDLDGFVALLARLMLANRTTGMQITTGDTRRGQMQWVYGRAGQPCRRCSTGIERAIQPGYGGDRVTFWCPNCQPITAGPITAG